MYMGRGGEFGAGMTLLEVEEKVNSDAAIEESLDSRVLKREKEVWIMEEGLGERWGKSLNMGLNGFKKVMIIFFENNCVS